jgi:acyl-CoA reductase-like NAD-dependent aldehyde dehydrogenase
MMPIPTQLFIDGKFRDAARGHRISLTNPATEEPLAEVAGADLQDLHEAVESANRAFVGGWRDLPPGKRTEILFNVARRLRQTD